MSYILDALRKSDQLRQRGAAPALLLGQAPVAAPKQPAQFYYGLLALLLLGAGIAIGWLRPWQPQPAAPAPPAIAVKPADPGQDQVPAATEAAPTPAPVRAQPREAAALKSERRRTPLGAAAEAPKKAAPPADRAASSSSGPAAAPPVATTMTMAELPLAIQQELPPMSISVHAYSAKTAERLVGINSRLLHEGEDVAPGLKLEQITPDGMILNYKGYSFRRGVR